MEATPLVAQPHVCDGFTYSSYTVSTHSPDGLNKQTSRLAIFPSVYDLIAMFSGLSKQAFRGTGCLACPLFPKFTPRGGTQGSPLVSCPKLAPH